MHQPSLVEPDQKPGPRAAYTYLPVEQLDRLDRYAQRRGLSRAAAMRMVLLAALDEEVRS